MSIFHQLIIFICLKRMIFGFGINLIKVPERESSPVLCTIALLKKYFNSGESLSGSILSMSISSAPLLIQNELLQAINEDDQYMWTILLKDARQKFTDVSSNAVMHQKPQCYFLIVDNLEDEDLEFIFDDWKTTVNWNPVAQFVVYLSSVEETNDEMNELMIEILLNFMNKKVYNINVIGQNDENGFYFGKTVFPYHPDNNCGNRVISIETLDICEYFDQYQNIENDESNQEDSFQKPENLDFKNQSKGLYLEEIYRALFLDKFPNDLNGCPLIAAYRPWEPYIFNNVYKQQENYNTPATTEGSAYDFDDSEPHLSGIEYKLIQTIADHLNINIDLQVESNNLYQLFQQLIDGDIELMFGGIDEDPSITQFVSSSIAYHQDDLTWCVAKAHRKHSLFNFLENFTSGTWTLTLIFLLIVSLNIVFIQKLLHVRGTNLQGYFATVLRVFAIMLSQSIQIIKITKISLKISLGITFFMALILSNVYQSFLFSTLTNPKNTYQISRLEELFRHRMTVMGSVENVRHLNKEGEIFKYIRENFQICYNIENCLREAAADEKLAVAVSRQHYFYNPRIPRESLYCFGRNENLYIYLITILSKKNFHLLHKINPIISAIIESGHLKKFARDLDGRPNHIYENPFQSLSFNQIEGSFAFSSSLLICSMFIFLLELWTDWMVNVRRTSSIIVYQMYIKLRQP